MWLLPKTSGTLVLVGLLLVGVQVRAETGLLSGALGRWLDTQVLPQLGEVLGEHPRFKGEKIRLVSLENGRPTDRPSRLHRAVEAHLTQYLLRSSGVRIAWADQPASGCGVTDQVVYLLGVEIERDGARYHRLNIGMIDVTESEWVSGVNHTWRGRLTATETVALGQTIPAEPAGTVDNPLPAHANGKIAAAMVRHLRCAHPEGLDGPLYLANAETPDLGRVMASLRSELASAPVAALTSDAADARWVLSLSVADVGAGTGTRQLGLLLTEQNDRLTQQVAAVYIEGTAGAPRYQDPDTRLAGGPGLLSEMRLEGAQREGICGGVRSTGFQCAEVSFELRREAYLFVLSSLDRQLHTTACDAQPTTAPSGERRFRVRVPPSAGELPDAGIYAIAISDRSAAHAVGRHIRNGVCSVPGGGQARWLAELDALLGEHADAVEWRAIHLTHTPGGVRQLSRGQTISVAGN